MRTEKRIKGKYMVFKTWRYEDKKRIIAVNLSREMAMAIVKEDIEKGGCPENKTMIVFDEQR